MSKKDDLEKKVARATQESFDDVAIEVWEFVRGNKSRGKAKDYFDNVHPAIKSLLTPTQVDLMENGPNEEGPSGDSSPLENDASVQLDIARELLDNKFKRVYDPLTGTAYCEVLNLEHQILRPFRQDAEAVKCIENILAREITKKLAPLASRHISEIGKLWMLNEEVLDRPKTMLKLGEPGWCFHRPLIEVKEGPMPTWEGILCRLSDRKAFAGWVWGVFSGDYKGRQTLWIHGPSGEERKSAIANALKELFGTACAAIGNAQFSGNEKRFLTSAFVDTQLVVYPDANNVKCLMSEAFKTISSDDPVAIEFKGKNPYTSKLGAKMLVCSNHGPFATLDNFMLSRLLYEFIVPDTDLPDVTAPQRLQDEMPFFLFYAKQCYEEVCEGNYKILTTSTTAELVDDLYADSFELFHEVFETNFTYTGKLEDIVTGSTVRTVLEACKINDTHKQSDFHNWMEKHFKIKKERIPGGNSKQFLGIKLGVDKKEFSATTDLESEIDNL